MSRIIGQYQQTGDSNDIGSGAFGTVYTWYLGLNKSFVYAGKLVRNKNWKSNEMTNLRECNHNNIVRYIDCVKDPASGDILLVTEFLNSTLFDGLRPTKESLYFQRRVGRGVQIIRSKFDPPLDKDEIQKIIHDTIMGLSYLHQKNIMHRDISSSNIMLGIISGSMYNKRQITAKIGDFGLAKLFEENQHPTSTLGNTFYSAPEAQGENQHYDGFAADTYSMGVVIVESLMSLTNNWPKIAPQVERTGSCRFKNVRDICFNVIKECMPDWDVTNSVLSAMIDDNADRRPHIDDELAERWWDKLDTHLVETSSLEMAMNNTNIDEDGGVSEAENERFTQLKKIFPLYNDNKIWEMIRNHDNGN